MAAAGAQGQRQPKLPKSAPLGRFSEQNHIFDHVAPNLSWPELYTLSILFQDFLMPQLGDVDLGFHEARGRGLDRNKGGSCLER